LKLSFQVCKLLAKNSVFCVQVYGFTTYSETINDFNLNILSKKYILSLIQNWITEVIADCLAVALIGPAYLFAFSEFIIQNLYGFLLRHKHPPHEYRIKIILKFLNNSFLKKITRSSFKTSEERLTFRKLRGRLNALLDIPIGVDKYSLGHDILLANGEAISQEDEQRLIKFLLDSLFIIQDRLHTHVDFSQDYYCQLEDIKHAIELQELLNVDLTPTKLRNGNIPSFSAIINAGWIHVTQNKKYQYNPNSDMFALDTINEFNNLQGILLKSIEIIQFSAEYNNNGE